MTAAAWNTKAVGNSPWLTLRNVLGGVPNPARTCSPIKIVPSEQVSSRTLDGTSADAEVTATAPTVTTSNTNASSLNFIPTSLEPVSKIPHRINSTNLFTP